MIKQKLIFYPETAITPYTYENKSLLYQEDLDNIKTLGIETNTFWYDERKRVEWKLIQILNEKESYWYNGKPCFLRLHRTNSNEFRIVTFDELLEFTQLTT